MKEIVVKTDIIPVNQYFVKLKGEKDHIDKEAICCFVATGFFLDNDTYWKNVKVLRPGTINKIDGDGFLLSSENWFNWHYSPREISFSDTVKEFTDLFDGINKSELENEDVILPISGGLDSRSQAASLLSVPNKVASFGYSFQNGFKESSIAKKIAKVANYPFKEFEITPNYLWRKIDFAAQTNKCYAEFTHCTQLRVIEEFKNMGTKFSLGHWGDVLFDKMTSKSLSNDEEILEYLKSIVIKPIGLELAIDLWKSWELEGNFEEYFNKRLLYLLKNIKIDNINAKIRAFKSLYWAPRWTSVNLVFYSSQRPVSLPYYNNKICQFICTIPEEYLADRKIQIEYIKNKSPKMARVTWQDKRPFNLYNYHLSKMPYNLPYKITNKLKREIKTLLGKPYVQRNWELQFLGKNNTKELKKYIQSSKIEELISSSVKEDYINKFYAGNQKHTSHSLSMLITLAAFSNHYLHNYKDHIKNK